MESWRRQLPSSPATAVAMNASSRAQRRRRRDWRQGQGTPVTLMPCRWFATPSSPAAAAQHLPGDGADRRRQIRSSRMWCSAERSHQRQRDPLKPSTRTSKLTGAGRGQSCGDGRGPAPDGLDPHRDQSEFTTALHRCRWVQSGAMRSRPQLDRPGRQHCAVQRRGPLPHRAVQIDAMDDPDDYATYGAGSAFESRAPTPSTSTTAPSRGMARSLWRCLPCTRPIRHHQRLGVRGEPRELQQRRRWGAVWPHSVSRIASTFSENLSEGRGALYAVDSQMNCRR